MTRVSLVPPEQGPWSCPEQSTLCIWPTLVRSQRRLGSSPEGFHCCVIHRIEADFFKVHKEIVCGFSPSFLPPFRRSAYPIPFHGPSTTNSADTRFSAADREMNEIENEPFVTLVHTTTYDYPRVYDTLR